MLRTFFPEDASALAHDLSNVTSLFYGLMLQVTAEHVGPDAVDALSQQVFYRLGRAKSRATRNGKAAQHAFHGDARDMVTILIAAIYNASPEYEFQVLRFEPDLCEVRLSGVDRYYRAANLLGIAHTLTWPTLHPFFEGINDELGLGCQVASQIEERDGVERMDARYKFERTGGVA